MKWRLVFNLWIVLFVLLPITATAEVTNAVISVDGMSCPFCAFGVEKKLKSVAGAEQVEVTMKDGSATLIAEEGKSIAIGQIGPAVKAAGFTPGNLKVTAVGTVRQEQEELLLDVHNTELHMRLLNLAAPLKQQLRSLAESGAVVRISGTVHDDGSDLPKLIPETVLEVTQ